MGWLAPRNGGYQPKGYAPKSPKPPKGAAGVTTAAHRPKRELIVTYQVPDDAPEWFWRCVEDGDHNGLLEYAATLRSNSIVLTGKPPALEAE